jgi:hypothetical protein
VQPSKYETGRMAAFPTAEGALRRVPGAIGRTAERPVIFVQAIFALRLNLALDITERLR